MRNLLYILFFTVPAIFCSCNDAGSEILSKSEMTDILYDFHVAQGVAASGNAGSPENEIAYRAAILKKYDVTQAEWDSSFNYYCRHTEEMHSIYTDLVERLQADVELAGGSISAFSDGVVGGDTTDVWNVERQFVLMGSAPYNLHSFHVDADTTYKAGDRFVMSYNTDFLVQTGMRDVVLVLGLKLSNDSIVTQVAHRSQNGKAEVVIQDSSRKGIKSIAGYFVLPQSLTDENLKAFRVVAIDGIRLLRFHVNETKSETALPATQTPSDTLDSKISNMPKERDSVAKINTHRMGRIFQGKK